MTYLKIVAMRKSVIILGLSLLASGAVYGQDVVGVETAPSAGQPYNQQLPWEKFVLPPNDFKPKEFTKPSFPFSRPQSVDRVDPLMPIAVPPTDLLSKFPIKEISRDFPSEMPIFKLEDHGNFKLVLPDKDRMKD